MLASTGFLLSDVDISEMPLLSALENASYAEDEAASFETMLLRANTAGDYFKTLKHASDLSKAVGFVNGTCITSPTITHESMKHHDASGKNLVIHSVTIDQTLRRKGCGSQMLKEYVSIIAKESKHIENVFLLSRPYLIPFYISCGFVVVAMSDVVHGQVRNNSCDYVYTDCIHAYVCN